MIQLRRNTGFVQKIKEQQFPSDHSWVNSVYLLMAAVSGKT